MCQCDWTKKYVNMPNGIINFVNSNLFEWSMNSRKGDNSQGFSHQHISCLKCSKSIVLKMKHGDYRRNRLSFYAKMFFFFQSSWLHIENNRETDIVKIVCEWIFFVSHICLIHSISEIWTKITGFKIWQWCLSGFLWTTVVFCR